LRTNKEIPERNSDLSKKLLVGLNIISFPVQLFTGRRRELLERLEK